jgi:hypothetical protein
MVSRPILCARPKGRPAIATLNRTGDVGRFDVSDAHGQKDMIISGNSTIILRNLRSSRVGIPRWKMLPS